MPIISSASAATSQAWGQFKQSATPVYVEDVFSTYLYTGNGTTQTITNGIDLSGKGGLVWVKSRTNGTAFHRLQTQEGSNYRSLYSNSTSSGSSLTSTDFSFNAAGFYLGLAGDFNASGEQFASWTFRKQPKFFDVVTYTGDGVTSRQIAHNLGSVPGMIIIKGTSYTSDWAVWHRGNGTTWRSDLDLNTTAASGNSGTSTPQTATYFMPLYVTNSGANSYNINGQTYVAYLFAHNAGGFGLDGTQNVISCGSFTTDGIGNGSPVTLGYEPQFVLIKCSSVDDGYGWLLFDTMRGFTTPGAANDYYLKANSSAAESGSNIGGPTSTGFSFSSLQSNATYIYMAIRRGPMKVPTDATTVFSPTIYTGDYNTTTPLTNMLPATDVWWNSARTISSSYYVMDRLRGWTYFNTPSTAAENSGTTWSQPTQTTLLPSTAWWSSSQSQVNYFFKRAPGFMDEVCYTGTGLNQTINHNLGAVPELIIVKSRSNALGWFVYNKTIGNGNYLRLNTTDAAVSGSLWANTTPTSTQFTVGAGNSGVTFSGYTYVAYLFASCPGVSKVGSYTGTGATQTISCGFTGGARYVLIKRTDSTGDWWVWDTARGMVAGTDPRTPTNSATPETNANWVYTTTGGFQIVTTDATVNASGGSYIYLAIA